jgi:endonuclease III
MNEYHALLVHVGKDYCRAREARCWACPLRPLLPGGPDNLLVSNRLPDN